MLVIFQQLGGIKGVLFYSVAMFTYAGTDMDPNLAAIILVAAQVLVLLVSTITVERLGRRISIMASELGMTASLAAFGVFFYLKAHNENTQLQWLPLTSLLFYVLSYNLGVGPVTWTLVSELLPANSKGLTSSIIAGFSHGLAFLITKFFLDLQQVFTPYGCYWFFGAASFAGFIFCLVVIPETRGKRLPDIQNFFKK
jgi:SP family facilitated glucose transporter-like MFS transporter 8